MYLFSWNMFIPIFAYTLQTHLCQRVCRLYARPHTGRSIVGNAGALITRVVGTKSNGEKNFVVVDGSMADLIRPSLYNAHHDILPLNCMESSSSSNSSSSGDGGGGGGGGGGDGGGSGAGGAGGGSGGDASCTTTGTPTTGSTAAAVYDVVGPVCESGDFLGKQRTFTASAVAPGALLAVADAGAYGFCMASNYNLRGQPAEYAVFHGDGAEAEALVSGEWTSRARGVGVLQGRGGSGGAEGGEASGDGGDGGDEGRGDGGLCRSIVDKITVAHIGNGGGDGGDGRGGGEETADNGGGARGVEGEGRTRLLQLRRRQTLEMVLAGMLP